MSAMTPEQRAAGLAAAARVRRADLLAAADGIAGAGQVEMLEAPVPRSVMLELETAAGAFCVSEVVVTTALVAVGGAEGWGCVMGWDDEGALAAATCSALADATVDEIARSALDDEREAAEREQADVAGTRLGR